MMCFQLHFGVYSKNERRYSYIKGCNSSASQQILWKQVVSCLAHDKKQFKTNLAKYGVGGGVGTVDQVTFRTSKHLPVVTGNVKDSKNVNVIIFCTPFCAFIVIVYILPFSAVQFV